MNATPLYTGTTTDTDGVTTLPPMLGQAQFGGIAAHDSLHEQTSCIRRHGDEDQLRQPRELHQHKLSC
jgi:hypothetical protein